MKMLVQSFYRSLQQYFLLDNTSVPRSAALPRKQVGSSGFIYKLLSCVNLFHPILQEGAPAGVRCSKRVICAMHSLQFSEGAFSDTNFTQQQKTKHSIIVASRSQNLLISPRIFLQKICKIIHPSIPKGKINLNYQSLLKF